MAAEKLRLMLMTGKIVVDDDGREIATEGNGRKNGHVYRYKNANRLWYAAS